MFRVEVKEYQFVERPARDWVKVRDAEVTTPEGETLGQYGYGAEYLKRTKEETTVLVMEVESLDLKSLTKTIQKAPKTEVQDG